VIAVVQAHLFLTDRQFLQVVFLSGAFYKFLETDRIIFRELMFNLGFALLGIAVIGVILLVHPGAVLILVLCIVMVDLMLFAEMWLFDISLNTVSVVNLVMAVGLAVDYSLHVLHTFLHEGEDTRNERVRAAMREIGVAVLLGVLSTLLGVVVLSGSSSHIIRVFFQLLTGTVVFGGFVGLFFLPALLTLIGPPPALLKAAPTVADVEKAAARESAKDLKANLQKGGVQLDCVGGV
jgi:Niemann-Pick C1 protein